ncbi:MAG: D-alanyl-D-alanine carboxypeptidase [Ruminococcaceae bacterium]|nr:D-alanyl-D-alanine carboxypeptidase [Oscillospiraceae bacterium]
MKIRFLVTWILVVLLLMPQQAQALEVSATAAILMDAETGQVYYQKNPDRRMLIASTTKIMTALVVLDTARLDEVVTVKPTHMVEGSSMYLKPGEELTVETLLYGLLLCSGNDAALALADYCADGVEHFVALMNEKAHELGMAGSSFANPNGLDAETHYSTARDMAILAACASQNETFVRLCSTRSVTIGGRTMTNHNKLLGYLEGCIGMKTGYTRAAGRTLVSCTRRDGRSLVAVTLQDGNDWLDHEAMYEYGFSLPAFGAEGSFPAEGQILLPDITDRLRSYLALRERGEVS